MLCRLASALSAAAPTPAPTPAPTAAPTGPPTAAPVPAPTSAPVPVFVRQPAIRPIATTADMLVTNKFFMPVYRSWARVRAHAFPAWHIWFLAQLAAARSRIRSYRIDNRRGGWCRITDDLSSTMKKLICILAGAALFAACEQKTENVTPASGEKKTENNTTVVKPGSTDKSSSSSTTTSTTSSTPHR